jgi:predicted Zn finger-like uncharacterized protein
LGRVPEAPARKETAVDEEALIVWQDVLDQIMAGRPGDLSCPHCQTRPMVVDERPDGTTRVSCSKCGKYIEGRFQP